VGLQERHFYSRDNFKINRTPLLLSGANYWAHRFRLRQQSDASSHSPDSSNWHHMRTF